MHSTSRDQKTQCDYPGCPQILANHSKMIRHRNEQHGDPKKCPIPCCKYKGTRRLELLKGHLETKHNLSQEEVARRMSGFTRSGRGNPSSSPDQGFGSTPHTPSGALIQNNSTTNDNASLSLTAFCDMTTRNTFEPVVQGTSMPFQPNQYTSPPQAYQDNHDHSVQPDFGNTLSLDQVQLLSEMHRYDFAHSQDSDFSNSSLQEASESAQYPQSFGPYVQDDSSAVDWMNMANSQF